jgi:3-phosphoshikimate 1-carboxyvinyltransferase
MANGESLIRGLPDGDDTTVVLDVAQELGRMLRIDSNTVSISGSSELSLPGIIDAQLAGTSSRFLTAMAVLANATTIIDGAEPLRNRPMADLHEALQSLGGEILFLGTPGHLPVSVSRGNMHGGQVVVKGNVSSQFISALMLIGPLLDKGIQIQIDGPLVSRSYVLMTADVMQEFGAQVSVSDTTIDVSPGEYQATTFLVEPDYSSAAFPLVATMLREGSVRVRDLVQSIKQGDSRLLDILRAAGISVTLDGKDIVAARDTDTMLNGIDIDMSDCSDLVPAVAVGCLGIVGASRLRGIGFIRNKESDRIGDLAAELRRFGADIEEHDDGLTIRGGRPLKESVCETHHDHRLAMALSLLALVVSSVGLDDVNVVSKSWPDYFADMTAILGTLSPAK